MSRLQKRLQQRKAEGRKAFVAYITAGDPSLAVTKDLVLDLARAGVDVIELGVPFSDPLADGPVNQRAAERALAAGTDLAGILQTVAEIRKQDQDIPLVLFSYLNPIFRMGFSTFAAQAAELGVDGVLTVDLPPEEADDYRREIQARGLDTVFLASPTSDEERLRVVNQQSSGFVYYVSRTGVTGVQAELSQSLEVEVQTVRKLVDKPIMVGFGISTPEQAATVGRLADGIIIGSALVKLIEESSDSQQRLARVTAFAQSIRKALDA